MHELSIAMSILDGVDEEMQRRSGRVDAVHIRIGPLSGVVKESLLSAWDLAREQTPYAASRLVFEDVPLVMFCHRCEAEQPVRSIQDLCCEKCAAPASQILHGRELQLAALELES